MEPDVSSPCPQEPATGPYPEPDEPNIHTPTLFPQDPFQKICHLRSGLRVIFLQAFQPKYGRHFSSPAITIDRIIWLLNTL
jgi:hypothetical protein